jgi:hypothetical protein
VSFDGTGSFSPFTPALRNVTAWSTGAAGKGLRVSSTTGYQSDLTVTNSILHGAAVDVEANADASPATWFHIVLDHSNYATATAISHDSSVTPPGTGTNQTAAPLLVDPASGDVHERLNSPTIDAGVTPPPPLTTDLDFSPRTQGASTDIGAYEFTPVPATISALAFARSKFRSTAKSGDFTNQLPAAASKKKKKKLPIGSAFTYQLDQNAVVDFEVFRVKPGRVVDGACVAPKPHKRPKNSCTRYVSVNGGFSVNAKAGTNSFTYLGRFNTGKLKGGKPVFKPLVPGTYVMFGTPTSVGSPAGQRVASKPFTIVP